VRASSADLMPALTKRNTKLARAFAADMIAAGRPDLAKLTTALEG